MPTKLTIFDRFFAKTFLLLIPRWVQPNHLTIFRYLTVPVVILLLLQDQFYWATVLFIISAFSDALDGALARTRNQVTDWGILHDPAADKLLVGSVTLIIVPKLLGFYLAAAIIFSEILIVIFGYIRSKGQPMPARTVGKIKAVFQCLGLIALLFFILTHLSIWLTLAQIILWIAVFLAFLSFTFFHSI